MQTDPLPSCCRASINPAVPLMPQAPAINSALGFNTVSTMTDSAAPTERTRVVRESQRAVYDRAEIYKILDEGFVCHVGFTSEGRTYVIPTMYARVGDALY